MPLGGCEFPQWLRAGCPFQPHPFPFKFSTQTLLSFVFRFNSTHSVFNFPFHRSRITQCVLHVPVGCTLVLVFPAPRPSLGSPSIACRYMGDTPGLTVPAVIPTQARMCLVPSLPPPRSHLNVTSEIGEEESIIMNNNI